MWKVVGGILLKGARWLGPKILVGAKKLGSVVSSTYTKGLNLATAKTASAILKTGAKLASVTSNPISQAFIKSAAKGLAKDAVLRPIIKDLTLKTTKVVVSKVPKVGKPASAILDVVDTVYGIPFI